MTVVVYIFFVAYLVFVMWLILGWRRLQERTIPKTMLNGLVSVIIPVRNEEHNIGLLLDDLINQHYQNFEVLVIDDHSGDQTLNVVKQYAVRDPRIKLLSSSGQGKKEALRQAIGVSSGLIIITTDGDCRVGIHWISGLCTQFTEDVNLVIGAVKMKGESFFSTLQTLELVSLVGVTASTAGWKVPIMANGANFAFRKTVFDDVNGYQDNLHIPSGDDEFLLRKVAQRFPGTVRFSADPATVVTTQANENLKQLMHQRIRWAGKWRSNPSRYVQLTAVFILCFQVIFVALPFLMLRHLLDESAGILLISLKIAIEAAFLIMVSSFLKLSFNWRAFFSLQVAYPFYVILIGVCSNFLAFEWKGRKLKSLTISNN